MGDVEFAYNYTAAFFFTSGGGIGRLHQKYFFFLYLHGNKPWTTPDANYIHFGEKIWNNVFNLLLFKDILVNTYRIQDKINNKAKLREDSSDSDNH